jgi:sugar lactone lactonase YvrE
VFEHLDDTNPPSVTTTRREEIYRRARRRRAREVRVKASLSLGAVLAAVAVVAAVAETGGSRPSRVDVTSPSSTVASATGVAPVRPGALAVAPNGDLYIADDAKHEILERLQTGRFRVVAGTGKAGFSGDGGPAIGAKISEPGGMAVAADGTLYFADSLNNRVRAVSPAGIISTIAGDGRSGTWVSDGTAALRARLSDPSAVTISPSGKLYIASSSEVVSLDQAGKLDVVLGSPQPDQALARAGALAVGAQADLPTGLAFDARGDLFVATFATKTLLMITSSGRLEYPMGRGTFYPRGSGGLVTAPDGTVVAMDTSSVLRLSPTAVRTVVSFVLGQRRPDTFAGVRDLSPGGIAVSRDGTIYVDTFSGNGYSDRTAIVAIDAHGQGWRLWAAGGP